MQNEGVLSLYLFYTKYTVDKKAAEKQKEQDQRVNVDVWEEKK